MVKRKNFLNRQYSLPSVVVIDPVNICNLHCPFCPTGTGKLNYEKTMMSFNTFKKIINKMPQVKRIFLANWGEPFLNPALFAMIKYAKKHSIYTHVDSNFSLRKKDGFFRDIVQSELDYLVISLDGASQATYAKYRRGGNFNLVINNIKTLTFFKNKFKSRTPDITWKFIINRFNEKEIIQALKIALDLGVKFKLQKMGLSDDLPDVDFSHTINERIKYWLPGNRKYNLRRYCNNYIKPLFNTPCPCLFESVVINPDGKVFPCLFVADKNHTFGNLLKESFSDIWNNDQYKFSRSLFTGEKYSGPITKTVCLDCDNYKKRKR